ncbi:DNA-binding response regulator [Peribacillus glennii]|uniref:DNA-binding response regulator n=1 Tax=Peribacillus glennii TaxID=2303991 RepID=A0A372L740_9BACI|nr:DNA-binding response regulator [Peribacillus glennii]
MKGEFELVQRILIVEDEEKIARILTLELTREGYWTMAVFDGNEGLATGAQEQWDLILLDVMLPGLNGLEVLRRLRNKEITTPVILLTARDAVPDKVSGLDLGAHDYITKPFDMEELLARIRACLRNSPTTAKLANEKQDSLSAGSLVLGLPTREVQKEGKVIELTAREFDLLAYLLQNKNLVVSRDQILTHVWGYDYIGETNVVDVYVRYLRKKIDAAGDESLIQTYRGVGYSIKEL